MVGFAIGCVPQSVTLFSEFLPTRQRARYAVKYIICLRTQNATFRCVVLLDCFWAAGACAEVLLAALVMPVGGWRWLLALSAFPSLAFAVAAAVWMPESARFNASRGQVIMKLYRDLIHEKCNIEKII